MKASIATRVDSHVAKQGSLSLVSSQTYDVDATIENLRTGAISQKEVIKHLLKIKDHYLSLIGDICHISLISPISIDASNVSPSEIFAINLFNKATDDIYPVSSSEQISSYHGTVSLAPIIKGSTHGIRFSLDPTIPHTPSDIHRFYQTIQEIQVRVMQLVTLAKDGYTQLLLSRDTAALALAMAKLEKSTTTQLELEHKNQHLQSLAYHDSLTSLPNRRAMDEYFATIPTGSSVTSIFIDLDYFKKINDIFGHTSGDKKLVEIAGILKSHIDQNFPSAFVGRLGGEEFVILIQEDDFQKLRLFAELIRLSISEKKIILDPKINYFDKNEAPIDTNGINEIGTASIGVAMTNAFTNPGHLLKLADDLMYTSKSGGRNQVTMGSLYNEQSFSPLPRPIDKNKVKA